MVQAALSFTRSDVDEIGTHFSALASRVPMGRITSPEGYERAVEALNALMDIGAGDEDHPLAGLLDLLGGLVGDYDNEHFVMTKGTPAGALRLLMDQHGLRQSDLPEIGSQGVVSEILSQRRALNVKQIGKLAERFGVSPAVFISSCSRT